MKFIKVLKPNSGSPAAQEISGQNFGRETATASVSSLSQPTTAGENNTSASATERRPGGGCIPVSGMHR